MTKRTRNYVSSDTIAIVGLVKAMADRIKELSIEDVYRITNELDFIATGIYAFPVMMDERELDSTEKALLDVIKAANIEDQADADVLGETISELADILLGYKAVKNPDELSDVILKYSEEAVKKAKEKYPKLSEFIDYIKNEVKETAEEIRSIEVSDCASLKEIGTAVRDAFNKIYAAVGRLSLNEELPPGDIIDVLNDMKYSIIEIKTTMTPLCMI